MSYSLGSSILEHYENTLAQLDKERVERSISAVETAKSELDTMKAAPLELLGGDRVRAILPEQADVASEAATTLLILAEVTRLTHLVCGNLLKMDGGKKSLKKDTKMKDRLLGLTCQLTQAANMDWKLVLPQELVDLISERM